MAASSNFINECKNPTYKNRYGKITIDNSQVELNQSNYIQEFSIDNSCYDDDSIIGTVYCKKLEARLIDSTSIGTSLIGQIVNPKVGVKYANNTTEYINLGKYKVDKPVDNDLENNSSFVAYDYLMESIDKPYQLTLDYSQSITVADLYNDVCSQLGLTPNTLTFTNSTIPIAANPFQNNESNRIVLRSICKVACSYVEIDLDNNKIDLSWLSTSANPDYTFQKSDYSSLVGGKIVYGPINSLIIKNSQIDSENVSVSDSESIALYGENQIVISEDYILHNATLRQAAITAIWNKVHNLTYTDCELICHYGKPFLKIGSKIRIVTDDGNIDTYVLQHNFKYDGTFYSQIKSPALTKQEITEKQDISMGDLLRLTQIDVNKQEGRIDEVVTQVNITNSTLEEVRTTQTATERRIDILSTNIDGDGNVTEVTTTTGFTFNANGMKISGDGFEAQHTSQGTYYKDGDSIVGQYTKEGSKQKDLELFGTYYYGKENINDTAMFVGQLYTDDDGEECFGHFINS